MSDVLQYLDKQIRFYEAVLALYEEGAKARFEIQLDGLKSMRSEYEAELESQKPETENIVSVEGDTISIKSNMPEPPAKPKSEMSAEELLAEEANFINNALAGERIRR